MALYNNCLFPVNIPVKIRPGSGQRAARIGPDPIFHIRFGSGSHAFFFFVFSAPEVAQIIIIGSDVVFVYLARLGYRCDIPDLLGLNKARSDPSPARQVEISSDRHFCSGPMVIVRQDSLTTTRSTQPVYLIFR